MRAFVRARCLKCNDLCGTGTAARWSVCVCGGGAKCVDNLDDTSPCQHGDVRVSR